MKFSLIKNIFLFLMIALFASACKRAHKKFLPVDKYSGYMHEQDGLEVAVKNISRTQAQEMFGFDVYGQGLRPLQLRIKNYSPSTFVMRPSYHELSCVSGKKVARHMHYDTFNWMTYLTMPALFFFWPLISFAIIPAGLGMKAYNKKTTRDMRKLTLNCNQSLDVMPYETVSKFVFVEDDSFSKQFAINFFNTDKKALLTYSVKL
jgi:hypothetical protein